MNYVETPFPKLLYFLSIFMIFGAFYERKSLDPHPPNKTHHIWSVCAQFRVLWLFLQNLHPFPILSLATTCIYPAALIAFDISCIYCIAYLCKIILPLLHFQRGDEKWVSAGNHLPYYYYNTIKSPKNFQELSVYIITNTWPELYIQQM